MTNMATRGDRTREQLLDVAEQLFGTHGVAHVSMRQIRIESGQKNEAAVQYHFGDRDGVILALSERHMPKVQAIQDRLIDTGGRQPSLRRLVEAMIRPLAEYSIAGPSERAWIKIVAELLSDPQLSLETLQEKAPPEATDVGVRLYERLSTDLPPEMAGERIWAVAQFAIHICADRARITDDPKAARPLSSDRDFIENLVDMALGALTAPIHAADDAEADRDR